MRCLQVARVFLYPPETHNPTTTHTMANNNPFELDSRLRAPNGTHQEPPPSHLSYSANLYKDDMHQAVLDICLQSQDLNALWDNDLCAK